MSILFAVLLFSILIFVHELGHFVTAKLSGVQVNEFSMFMGPLLYQKQIGETMYSIRLIPFGGYCAMEGEDGDSENPRAFSAAAWWKRLIILCAGSAMNFIAGLLILVVVFSSAVYMAVPQVDLMEPGCTLGGENGIQVGDELWSLDGERIYTQSDFSLIMSFNPGDTHDLVIKRNGEKIRLDNFLMEKHEFPNEDGTTTLRYGFSFAIKEADTALKLEYTWRQAMDIVRSVRLSLRMIFGGQAKFSDVSGPVGIVQQMSETAEQSESAVDALYNMLYFGAFIAINLAVMNLLPVPALDGGRVLCLLITVAAEAVLRRKIDPKYEGYLHTAGMILLLGFMAIVTFKDIFAIFMR